MVVRNGLRGVSMSVSTNQIVWPMGAAKRSSRLQRAWSRFAHDRMPVVGLLWLLILVIVAIFGQSLAPYPLVGDLASANQAPSIAHLFGTNNLGQDMLTVCMYGIRYTLEVGAGATVIAFLIGVVIGLVSGMAGGIVDQILMRFTDLMYSFPSLLFAIMLVQLFGESVFSIAFVLGITQWAGFSRLTRGLVLSIRNSELVESGHAIGATPFFISTRYVLPHVINSIIVYTAFFAVNAITLEAMMSIFEGIGPNPPMMSFGSLLIAGVPNVLGFPWMMAMPVLVFISILIALVVVGEGLQAALNPKGTTTL